MGSIGCVVPSMWLSSTIAVSVVIVGACKILLFGVVVLLEESFYLCCVKELS